MGWFFSAMRSLRRPSRNVRRAPKRNRSLILEDLEGRRLPAPVLQSFATLPGGGSSNMVTGPDGDLWVGVNPTLTNPVAAIDRIGLNGSVTSFPVPGPADSLSINWLTTGPDGNVWFAADYATSPSSAQVVLGNVTPAGDVTEFPPIPVAAGRDALAGDIVSGPGGDLWFGYTVSNLKLPDFKSQNFIGQVTTAGAVTLFPISSYGPHTPLLDSIAAGSDGNLWFTEGPGKKIVFGRMLPSGVVTRFPIGQVIDGDIWNEPNGSFVVNGVNHQVAERSLPGVNRGRRHA